MIVFVVMLVLVGVAAELYSLKHALDGVSYDIRFSRAVVEPEEPLQLITVLTNRRRRFMPWIMVRQNVPDNLKTDKPLYTNIFPSATQLQNTMYMMPRQRLTRRTPISLPDRGRYLFSGARIFGGDFLGLSERAMDYAVQRELVVRPRASGGIDIRTLLSGTMGLTSVNRFIFEDPILTLGFREYTGREPMKQIAWAQSARLNQLMVRQCDHTVERTVTVIFNVDTLLFDSYGHQIIERCCSLARAVCEALEESHIPWAFISNATAAGRPRGFGQVNDGLGEAHLNTVLEGLGRVDYTCWESLEALLGRAALGGAMGRAHILITPSSREAGHALLEKLRLRCGQAVIPLTGEEMYNP